MWPILIYITKDNKKHLKEVEIRHLKIEWIKSYSNVIETSCAAQRKFSIFSIGCILTQNTKTVGNKIQINSKMYVHFRSFKRC